MISRVVLIVAVSCIMGIQAETVLTKDYAESLIDIAWKKYDAFIEKKPDLGHSGQLLQCEKEADGFVCNVNSNYVLPRSLVSDLMAYFRAIASSKYPLSRVVTATNDVLHMFMRRVDSVNFNVYITLQKDSLLLRIP